MANLINLKNIIKPKTTTNLNSRDRKKLRKSSNLNKQCPQN